MSIKRYAFLLFGILGWGVPAAAQPIDSLIQRAWAQNAGLQVLAHQQSARALRADQFAPRPDPTISAGLFPLPVETRLGAQAMRVSFQQLLPQPGLVAAQQALARAEAEPLQAQQAARRLLIAAQLVGAWYRWYELKATAEVLREQYAYWDALEQLALQAATTGSGRAADVAQLQLARQRLTQEIDLLRNAEALPRAAFAEWLQLPDTAWHIELPDTLAFAEWPYDVEALRDRIATDHPALQVWQAEQVALRQRMAIIDLERQPQWGIGLDYIAVVPREAVMADANGRDIVQLSASVRIPLYRDRFKAKTQEATLQVAALDAQQEQWKWELTAQLQRAEAAYQTARLQYDYAESQYTTTQTAIDLLLGPYANDGARLSELLPLYRSLTDWRKLMVQATVASWQARLQVEQYLWRNAPRIPSTIQPSTNEK